MLRIIRDGTNKRLRRPGRFTPSLFPIADRPLKNRTPWDGSFATKSGLTRRRICREGEEIFSRAYCRHLEAGGTRDSRWGAVQAARDIRAALLPLQDDLREHGALGGEGATAAAS